MPGADVLAGWVRDPAFGSVIDPVGAAQTGEQMLAHAADWLTWCVSRDAVETVSAMLAAGGAKPT
jgi:hypothetical protein